MTKIPLAFRFARGGWLTKILLASRFARGSWLTKILLASRFARGGWLTKIPLASGFARGSRLTRISLASRFIRGYMLTKIQKTVSSFHLSIVTTILINFRFSISFLAIKPEVEVETVWFLICSLQSQLLPFVWA